MLKSICDKSKRKGEESLGSNMVSSAKRARTVKPDSFPLQSSAVHSASVTRAGDVQINQFNRVNHKP